MKTDREDFPEQLSLALAKILVILPVFAHVLMSVLKIRISTKVPTMATDGWTVWINPWFVSTGLVTIDEVIYVLCHEIGHAMLWHMVRAKGYAERGFGPGGLPWDAKYANMVMDFVINMMLDNAGIRGAPTGDFAPLRHEAATPEKTWEMLYVELWDEFHPEGHQPPPPPDEPEDGDEDEGGTPGDKPADEDDESDESEDESDGSDGDESDDESNKGSDTEPCDDESDGSDDSDEPGQNPDDPSGRMNQPHGGFDNHVDIDPDEPEGERPSESEMKQAIIAGMNAAKGRGTLPGGFEVILNRLLEPKRDWTHQLWDEVVPAFGRETGTWNRLHRRLLTRDIGYPGLQGYGLGHLVLFADSSGSTVHGDPAPLAVFIGEMIGMIRDAKPQSVSLYWGDMGVWGPVDIQYPEQLETEPVQGGGGTDLRVGLRAINEEQPGCICVVLTDGDTPWPEEKPDNIRKLIVVTTHTQGCEIADKEIYLDMDEYSAF